MKSYALVSKKNHSKTQSTQTHLSELDLIKQLREKDEKIKQLQKALQQYTGMHINLSDSADKTLDFSPSLTNSAYPEVSPHFRAQQLISSYDQDKKTNALNQLSAKVPLDTANIQELNKALSKKNLPTSTPEPPNLGGRVFSKTFKKRKLQAADSKNTNLRSSKFSLRNRQKLNKNTSIISELLYQDDQDKEGWNFVLSKFREDPNLMSKALMGSKKKEEIKARGSVSTEPQIRARINSAYQNRKQSQEVYIENRPSSASYNKTGRSTRPITAKIREADWSRSILDTYVAQNSPEFPLDTDLLQNNDVEQLIITKNFHNFDSLFDKAQTTLAKLKFELMIPSSYMIVPPKSIESLEKILQNCSQLFRVRAIIVKILKLIHSREDSLLKLMASDEENVGEEYINLQRLSQEILQSIVFIKHIKFPMERFVYLGEDYSLKIEKDNDGILMVFPNLNQNTEFL